VILFSTLNLEEASMWTAANRKSYERKGLRYPSDMTDAEWVLVKPLVDVPQHGQGRRRQVDLREVLNAVFYILETGCQWRALPRDLPPRSTVHGYFIRWQCDRTLSKLHHELYVQAREQAGKEASPTTAIVDSQSIRSAERGAERRIRLAGMPARRSRDASAMRSSMRSG
jgi:transposase